jgi:hypothetical protein
VFWTVPIDNNSVQVDLDSGEATYRVHDLAMPDYFDIPNALFRFEDPVSTPGVVSFDLRWFNPLSGPVHIDNTTQPFVADMVRTDATIVWSAHNGQGFSFVSDPAGTSTRYAQLGRERNGVFYSHGGAS